MKSIIKICYLLIVLNICFTQGGELPLTDRYFFDASTDLNNHYRRGTYLIVLAGDSEIAASLETILRDENTGDFIYFKQSQGYDVKIINFQQIGGTASLLRSYLQYYIENYLPWPLTGLLQDALHLALMPQ